MLQNLASLVQSISWIDREILIMKNYLCNLLDFEVVDYITKNFLLAFLIRLISKII